MLSRLRHIVGKLHAQQVVHVRTERQFYSQGHLWCQRRFAVKKIEKSGPADFQDFRRLRHREAK